jgi:hypothetical protein
MRKRKKVKNTSYFLKSHPELFSFPAKENKVILPISEQDAEFIKNF